MQVFDCKTIQLLQRYSLPGTADDFYECVTALPAGRIAAGNRAGIDMLDLDMAGCAAQTVLSTADAGARYAACLGKAAPETPRTILGMHKPRTLWL